MAGTRAGPSVPLGLLLFAATLLAYLPALSGGYVWDDDYYLTENPHLEDTAGLERIWVPGNTPQYYPAVFTTFWLERRVFGLAPAGYHAINVLLHASSALLVWRVGRRLALPGAWFLAALFALHPVQVESVAWITERKNVLSTFFYLLAFLAYLRFEEGRDRPPRDAGQRRRRPRAWYGAALVLFALALLSKTVACSLPVALILALLWQGKRPTLTWLVPLAPLFALGLALALVTIHLEQVNVGAQGVEFAFGPAERVLIATRALVFYAEKLLLPWPLVFVYPRWALEPARLLAWWPVLVVVVGAGLALRAYRSGRRGPALALAYFAATLFPALGFFNVYPMRYSFVADHFQYQASLGFLALLVGAAAALVRSAWMARALGAVVLAALALLTWHQSSVFADQETLWRTTIERNPGAWMAHANLAKLLSERGDDEAALEHMQTALAAEPGLRAADQIQKNLATLLGKLGRHEEALALFRTLQTSVGGQRVPIAMTLERLGRDAEAEAEFRAALSDGDPRVLVPFGLHLLRLGRPEEAAELLGRHVAASPVDMDGLMFFADACAASGRLEESVHGAERALALARARHDVRSAELIETRLAQYRASQE